MFGVVPLQAHRPPNGRQKWDVITAMVDQGPHPTARTQDSISLFKEDIEYQIKAGFCKVYLWEDLKKLRPANLKTPQLSLSRKWAVMAGSFLICCSQCTRTKMASSQSPKIV